MLISNYLSSNIIICICFLIWFDLTHFRKLRQKYRNILVRFLVQMKTLKFASEISWPLVTSQDPASKTHPLQSSSSHQSSCVKVLCDHDSGLLRQRFENTNDSIFSWWGLVWKASNGKFVIKSRTCLCTQKVFFILQSLVCIIKKGFSF